MSLLAGVFSAARRLRPVLFVIASLALGGYFVPPASADPAHDVYTITGVPVDATAASGQAARDQAIAAGERRAVRLLLERLASRRDYPRLPQVAAADLVNLVDGFEVSNERSSGVHYAADLTVSFRPDAIRALMAQATIPIADTPSRLVLVLPVWRSPQGLQLFDDTNPWRDAWIRIASGKGLVPLTTPLGDAGDLAAISAEQASSGNQAALAAIAQRYNVSEVIVAQASGDAKGETIDQLVVTRYVIGGQRSTVNATTRRPPEALLATALGISQEVEESWKANTINANPGVANVGPSNGNVSPPPGVDSGNPTLNVMVPVHQLSEWLAIRKKLNDVPQIKKIDVSSLGLDGAAIVLNYIGGPQQLQAALAQSDLILSNDGGNWILRARAGAVTPTPVAAPATPPTTQPSAPSNQTPASIAPAPLR